MGEEAATQFALKLMELVFERLRGHVDTEGHSFVIDRANVLNTGCVWSGIIGEAGASALMRRIHPVDKTPDFGQQNEAILGGFFRKGSIRLAATKAAIKCGADWMESPP